MSKPKLIDVFLPEYRSKSFGNAVIGGGPDSKPGVPGASTGYIKIPQPPRGREDSFPYLEGDPSERKKEREELEDEDIIVYGSKETADKMRHMLDPFGIGTRKAARPGDDTYLERSRGMKQLAKGGNPVPHEFEDDKQSDEPGFIEFEDDEDDDGIPKESTNIKELSTLDMLANTGNIGRPQPGHRGAGVHQRQSKTGGRNDSQKINRIPGWSSTPDNNTFDVPPWLNKKRTDVIDLFVLKDEEKDENENEDKINEIKQFIREYVFNEASIIRVGGGPRFGTTKADSSGRMDRTNAWAVGGVINRNKETDHLIPSRDNTDAMKLMNWYFDDERDEEIEKRENNENNSKC